MWRCAKPTAWRHSSGTLVSARRSQASAASLGIDASTLEQRHGAERSPWHCRRRRRRPAASSPPCCTRPCCPPLPQTRTRTTCSRQTSGSRRSRTPTRSCQTRTSAPGEPAGPPAAVSNLCAAPARPVSVSKSGGVCSNRPPGNSRLCPQHTLLLLYYYRCSPQV